MSAVNSDYLSLVEHERPVRNSVLSGYLSSGLVGSTRTRVSVREYSWYLVVLGLFLFYAIDRDRANLCLAQVHKAHPDLSSFEFVGNVHAFRHVMGR